MRYPRYLCIHGHFYQPPRENPWLGVVEVQDSAAPFHDWNERITHECYAPNTRARLLDGDGQIINLLNNYAWISFNFGPTLLQWMADAVARDAPGDRRGRPAESGPAPGSWQRAGPGVQSHHPAPGQHAGQADAGALGYRRFPPSLRSRSRGDVAGRDGGRTSESLEVLAEAGIRFTILAPRQARRWRKLGEKNWTEIRGGIDPSRAYLCPASLGALDRPVLLRRHRLPAGRLRAAARPRRAVPGAALPGVRRQPRASPAHAHRHRRRIVRPPPCPRRHGAGLCARRAVPGPRDPADQLRRVPRASSPRVGGRDPRQQLVELRPRRRTLAIRLRLQDARRLAPEMASAACGTRSNTLKDQLDHLFSTRGRECFPNPWVARDAFIDVILRPQ